MNPKKAAAKLQSLGRGDDTILAHINKREAAMLKREGGSGARNPKTGLLEFDDGGNDGYTSAPAPASNPFGSGSSDTHVSFGDISQASDDPFGGGDPSSGNTNMSGVGANAPFGFEGDPSAWGDPSAGDMFPAAEPRQGVGSMEGMPQQAGWQSTAMEVAKRLAKAKAWQMGLSALGVPGAAIGMLIGPAMAAWNAPKGQGLDAFGRTLATGWGNQVANQATGGLWGGAGMSIGDLAKGGGTAPTYGPDGKPTGASGSGYQSEADYARGAAGLLGAYSMYKAGRGSDAERTAGGQLSGLLRDPSSITKMPGYSAGLQAVQRAAAGQGYLSSGNLSVALSKYGGDFYNQSVNTLNTISNQNAGVNQRYKENSLSLLGQALGSLGYAYTRSNMGGRNSVPSPAPEMTSDLGDFYG